MKSDYSHKTDDFFEKHFEDAKRIRAICDDLHFPAEYSPVFVNIHIRGTDHFQSPPLPKEYYKKVFSFLDPESEMKPPDLREQDEDNPFIENMKNLIIKDRVMEWDQILENHNGKQNYFSNQLKMIERLYLDDDFMNHMVALYTYFVKPIIPEYDEEKIRKAFYKGLINDINQEICDYYKENNPDA